VHCGYDILFQEILYEMVILLPIFAFFLKKLQVFLLKLFNGKPHHSGFSAAILSFLSILLIFFGFIYANRFVRGSKPGRQTGFDIGDPDLLEMEQCHGVVVASAIFGIALVSLLRI